MQVIADSSILIHLATIGRFYLLQSLFKKLTIPHAVYIEVVEEGWGLPGSSEVEEALTQGWISIRHIVDKTKIKDFTDRYKINVANAEVIQLAIEIKPDIVLVNEAEIRTACEEYGFKIKGCLGIILKAVKEKLIAEDDVLKDIDHLVASGYRIDEDIAHSVEKFLGRKEWK